MPVRMVLRMKNKLLLAAGVLALAMFLSTAILRVRVDKEMFSVVGRQNDVEINKGILKGVRSPPIEVHRVRLPTRMEIQTEAEGTESHQTKKTTIIAITPATEEFSGRRTSVDRVPDKISVQCDIKRLSHTPYRSKKHCCQQAEHRTLPELCGELNASSIRNESRVEGCTCTDLLACKAVVLTATSSNHWMESLDAIASVQNLMPDMKIIMMDIGMSAKQVEQLQQLRNVEVQKFPFDSFPPHVKRLNVFAWKSLSIQMMLSKYEVVFYMDASIRLRRPLVDILYPSLQSFPIRVRAISYYDGAFTRDETYKYLGVTRKQVSKRYQKEGGLQMYRNCSFLHERVISALVDCALHEECIAPSGASRHGCDLSKYNERVKHIDAIEEVEYMGHGCHRFDQSVLTSVLEREFHLPNDSPPVEPIDYYKTLVVWRKSTNCFTLFLKE